MLQLDLNNPNDLVLLDIAGQHSLPVVILLGSNPSERQIVKFIQQTPDKFIVCIDRGDERDRQEHDMQLPAQLSGDANRIVYLKMDFNRLVDWEKLQTIFGYRVESIIFDSSTSKFLEMSELWDFNCHQSNVFYRLLTDNGRIVFDSIQTGCMSMGQDYYQRVNMGLPIEVRVGVLPISGQRSVNLTLTSDQVRLPMNAKVEVIEQSPEYKGYLYRLTSGFDEFKSEILRHTEKPYPIPDTNWPVTTYLVLYKGAARSPKPGITPSFWNSAPTSRP